MRGTEKGDILQIGTNMNFRTEFIDAPIKRSEEGVSLDAFFAELLAESDERIGSQKQENATKRKPAANKNVR